MQETKTNRIKKTDPDNRYRRVLAASTLAGDSVRNSAGEDLGKVDEIMIDIPSGKVAYAVLSFGGVLRMGNKLFAVPWSALTVDEDEKCFILDVDKQTLESAPGFDKDNWLKIVQFMRTKIIHGAECGGIHHERRVRADRLGATRGFIFG